METKAGTIIAAVDGSESSDRAVAWAAEQAVSEHRDLTLVHAIDAIHTGTPSYVDAAQLYPEEARTELTSGGRKMLQAAREKVEAIAPELEVHEVTDFADPRVLLLELSKDAAMVVLGSRGRGPLRSLLLGSVGVALVRHAHCPVVVHRPGVPGTAHDGVVVGVETSAESHLVLEFAFRQASLRALPLTVLHCYWEEFSTAAGVIYQTPEAIEAEREALEATVAEMSTRYSEVSVTTQIRPGPPYEVLAELGERMDLIVVGAHQSGRLSRMAVGSVSVGLVERASRPVAVVPMSTPQ